MENSRENSIEKLWNRWKDVWCEMLGWNHDVPENITGLDNFKEKLLIKSDVPENDLSRHFALYLFYCIFKDSYNTAKSKTEYNKNKNTELKNCFVRVLYIAFGIHIILPVMYVGITFYFGCSLFRDFSVSHLAMVEAYVLIVVGLLALIIAKKLDIAKYQETWSRHTRFQYQRNQEMLRFLLAVDEPYKEKDSIQRIDAFVKAILAIEEKNIEKFCLNMEEKEKEMMAELQSFINKKAGQNPDE